MANKMLAYQYTNRKPIYLNRETPITTKEAQEILEGEIEVCQDIPFQPKGIFLFYRF